MGGVAAILSTLGLEGRLTALIQRRSCRNQLATAAKGEATGEAAVIASMTMAFTGMTSALREKGAHAGHAEQSAPTGGGA